MNRVCQSHTHRDHVIITQTVRNKRNKINKKETLKLPQRGVPGSSTSALLRRCRRWIHSSGQQCDDRHHSLIEYVTSLSDTIMEKHVKFRSYFLDKSFRRRIRG